MTSSLPRAIVGFIGASWEGKREGRERKRKREWELRRVHVREET